MKLISVIGYLLMITAVLSLAAMHLLFSFSAVVIVVQLLSVVLMVWARKTFGMRSFHVTANTTEGALITNGPYKFIRHPIYASILYFAFAGIMANLIVVSVLLFMLLIAGCFIRIFTEEKYLKIKYPEYKEYSIKTKRIIPYIF